MMERESNTKYPIITFSEEKYKDEVNIERVDERLNACDSDMEKAKIAKNLIIVIEQLRPDIEKISKTY